MNGLINRSRLFPIAVLFILLVSFARTSAETLNFKNFSVGEGLANSTVYSVFQDSKGFIWFATESGVNRFNGQQFELFTMNDGLSDNEVLAIGEDREGRIWFLTLNGRLSYYHNGEFSNPDNNAVLKKAICEGSFISFLQDSKGNLWFTTNQNKVLKIENSRKVLFYEANTPSLANSAIFESDAGEILAFGNGYLLGLMKGKFIPVQTSHQPLSHQSVYKDPETAALLYLSPKGLARRRQQRSAIADPLRALQGVSIGSLLTDKQERLWLATMNEGIFLYDFSQRTAANHLQGKRITNIMEDTQGNIWVSTVGHGVYMLPFYTRYTQHLTTEDGLTSNAINSVLKASGQLILGLRNGSINTITDGKVTQRQLGLTDRYDPVKELYFHNHDKSLWYASDNTLINVHPEKGMIDLLEDKRKTYALKSFSISKDGQIAVALASGVYITPNKNTPFNFADKSTRPHFSTRAFSVFFDSADRLWFSNIHGLHYLSKGKVIQLYKHSSALRQRITDIAELPDGTIACSTYGFGMIFLKDNKIIATVATEDGLTSNICKKLFVEGNTVWVVTGKGISEIDCSGEKFATRSYTMDNGLISNEINDVYVNADTVYVATNNGLSMFSTYDIALKDKPAPRIYLNYVQANKQNLPQAKHHQLNHEENNLTVNFIALDFAHPNYVSYSYQLNNDTKWIETSGNTIEFGSLEPGTYALRIRAKSLHTAWSAPILVNFTITPPFWKSWWFISLTLLLLASALALTLRSFYTARQAKEKEKLLVKTRLISLEQQALQAMMNPHFIFNVMNSIQYFINTKDHTMANQFLTGFARLIRKNLEICSKSYISIEEEINYLNLYLALEKLRFGNKMEYNLTIDDSINLQETYIPSMLLQPYVENAIWHGIMPKDEAGRIEISIYKDDAFVHILITDDGIGIDNSLKQKNNDHISQGMKLTQQRISLLNKFKEQPITIKASQLDSGGTQIEITIPFKPFTHS